MLKDRIPDSQQYEIGGILAVRVRSVADKAYCLLRKAEATTETLLDWRKRD